jgi:hypothetical protein
MSNKKMSANSQLDKGILKKFEELYNNLDQPIGRESFDAKMLKLRKHLLTKAQIGSSAQTA